MGDPYREQMTSTNPNPLTVHSLSVRFKQYLMSIEMLIIDMPDIIAELKENNPETIFLTINRLEQAMARIAEAGRLP